MADDEKVVELKQPDETTGRWPVELKPWNSSACPHTITLVDDRARTLTCKACDVAVDPIEFLARLAKSDDRVHWERERLEELRRGLLIHALDYKIELDGSERLTLCGTRGEHVSVTRRRIRVSCKRCNARLDKTRGPLSSENNGV